MERCARALARSVGYMGAATVEFLYIMDSRQYCFLELNPRLQVEHPVTEWISNVNIPACQLLVGMGVPLHAIPDLRRMLGADPAGSGALDWEGGARVAPAGHVVAVRITAGGHRGSERWQGCAHGEDMPSWACWSSWAGLSAAEGEAAWRSAAMLAVPVHTWPPPAASRRERQ